MEATREAVFMEIAAVVGEALDDYEMIWLVDRVLACRAVEAAGGVFSPDELLVA